MRLFSYKYISACKTGVAKLIKESFNTYGFDAHVFEVVEETDASKLNEREVYWIRFFNSYRKFNPKGLNQNIGGAGGRSDDYVMKEYNPIFDSFIATLGVPFTGTQYNEDCKRLRSLAMTNRNLKHNITVPEWGTKKAQEKNYKPVLVYDCKGNFVGQYGGMTIAAKELGFNRRSGAEAMELGKLLKGQWFFMPYDGGDIEQVIEIPQSGGREVKPIVVIIGDKVDKCANLQEASQKYNVAESPLRRACLTKSGKVFHETLIFYYESDYNSIFAHLS